MPSNQIRVYLHQSYKQSWENLEFFLHFVLQQGRKLQNSTLCIMSMHHATVAVWDVLIFNRSRYSSCQSELSPAYHIPDRCNLPPATYSQQSVACNARWRVHLTWLWCHDAMSYVNVMTWYFVPFVYYIIGTWHGKCVGLQYERSCVGA